MTTYTEFGISELTINIRVNKARNNSGETFFAVRDTQTYDEEISIGSLSTSAGNVGTTYYQNSMKFQGNTNSGISNGTRMNLVLVVGQSGNKYYINGVQKSLSYSTGNANTGLQNAMTNLMIIGRHPTASANWFQGYISNAIIENKQRTEEEIQEYFNDTKEKYGY